MWICSKCERIFDKENQPHSCQKVPLEQHFINKDKAKELFNYLVDLINRKVGDSKVISLPCCVHLFGTYDFLAALPKKNTLEIRFALDRKLPQAKICVPLSAKKFKNCFNISSIEQFDHEFVSCLKESYNLKDSA